MNSNVEKKDHKVIFKVALIGNIFALATNISCFILYLLVLILTDFNNPVGPVLLIILIYGQIRIGGWHTFYMFFNRRVAPEGAVDPSPR